MTGYSSETDSQAGLGIYSLQGNSNYYRITYNGKQAGAWTQFVFATTPGIFGASSELFIEWWLIGYGASCPFGWTPYGGQHCYLNSNMLVLRYFDPSRFVSDLYSLGGGRSGTGLQVQFCDASRCYQVTDQDALSLLQSNNWQDIEWNVFGACCGSQANFNSGVSLNVVVIPMDTSGYESADFQCKQESFTGETNNLNLGPSCTADSSGAMYFTESN